MNKMTMSWHAAAAVFAYGYATLAEYKYKYVGQDQLIGGTWPDNEPGVSCMDWQSGQPNAKYWITQLLAKTVGDGKAKTIHASNATVMGASPPAPAGTVGDGTCGATDFKPVSACNAEGTGAIHASAAGITDLAGCVAAVSQCKHGNYASFSAKNDDCSWYSACDMTNLLRVGAGYKSQVLHPNSPVADASTFLHIMPYTKDDVKGLLLINKKAAPVDVKLADITGGVATIVEYDLSVSATAPATNPPVARRVGASGTLRLGAFGTAIVRDIAQEGEQAAL